MISEPACRQAGITNYKEGYLFMLQMIASTFKFPIFNLQFSNNELIFLCLKIY